jgi:hypothetical protein
MKTTSNPVSKDVISIEGILNLHLYDKNNKLLRTLSGHNLIVMMGYHTVAKALSGVSNSHIAKIAIGTNGNPKRESDLKITNPLLFNINRIEYPKPGIVRFHFNIGYQDAVGMNIREFGLITAGNKLFSRKTREVIEKTEDFRIMGYWDIVICENFDPEVYFLTLDGENTIDTEFATEGGSITCTLDSSHPWTAYPENLHFTNVVPSSGPAGDGQQIIITAIVNTGAERSESVVFDNEIGQSAQVNILQLGVSVEPPTVQPYITINDETDISVNVDAEGDTLIFTLNTSSEWEVTDGFAFGTVLPASGPAGDGQSITVTINANAGVARSDSMVFTNSEGEHCLININQAAGEGVIIEDTYIVTYDSNGGTTPQADNNQYSEGDTVIIKSYS